MTTAIHVFPDEIEAARRLGQALAVPVRPIAVHRFPDGEVLPTVAGADASVLLYCPLHQPNEKLVRLGLAVDALRRAGAKRLTLVAPYLSYLRQDAVFVPGQSLSRDVIGRLLAPWFDRIVTVEAHMHRTTDLSAVFAHRRVDNLSAMALLSAAFGEGEPPIACGPDEESAPWVRSFAAGLGGETLLFTKRRLADDRVVLESAELQRVRGRRIVLVDDICSSGGTLAAAATRLAQAGARAIEIGVVHALFDGRAEQRMRGAGVVRIVSTDSVPHPTSTVMLAPLLANALQDEVAQ